jgi:hypothetical protein
MGYAQIVQWRAISQAGREQTSLPEGDHKNE